MKYEFEIDYADQFKLFYFLFQPPVTSFFPVAEPILDCICTNLILCSKCIHFSISFIK